MPRYKNLGTRFASQNAIIGFELEYGILKKEVNFQILIKYICPILTVIRLLFLL